jgi:hypothetical protein
MKNKKFRDLSNNKIVQVTDNFEDIVILDGKSKIKINQLMNTSMFEEYIDPNSFLRNDNFINNFSNQLKSIPLDDFQNRIPAEEMGFKNTINTGVAEVDLSNIPYDPEREKEELLKKAQTVYNYGNTQQMVQKQLDSLRNILDEDEELESIQESIQSIPQPILQQPTNQIIQQETKIENNTKMDPILEMFKNVKRNTNFKIEFTVENKIPRIDFIEMMEDSYNTSIIDFLAQEFTEQIVRDPNIIKEKIKSKLMDLVYPDDIEKNRTKIEEQTK